MEPIANFYVTNAPFVFACIQFESTPVWCQFFMLFNIPSSLSFSPFIGIGRYSVNHLMGIGLHVLEVILLKREFSYN